MAKSVDAKHHLVKGLLNLPGPALRALAGKPVVIDGKTLDPGIQLVLRLMPLEGKPLDQVPVSKGRRALRASAQMGSGSQPIGSVSDRVIDGPHGDMTLRFYSPEGITGLAPALVFYHGGGWVVGDLDSHDGLCRFIAEQAQVRVISVDYALAPEHPYPAGPLDAIAAWQWVVDNADAIGVDADRIAVGGDSAGGNLAAVVCQDALASGKTLPALQFLIYPATDHAFYRPSREKFGDGFFLTKEKMDFFFGHYLVGDEDKTEPRLSPLHGVTEGLSPAYVLTAGFDPLLDEGLEYAEKLREVGVEVEYVCAESMIHGYANMIGISPAARKSMRRAAAALQRGLSVV